MQLKHCQILRFNNSKRKPMSGPAPLFPLDLFISVFSFPTLSNPPQTRLDSSPAKTANSPTRCC
ncbi:hypothetical protein L211DRAFT_837368 [Terfezia boudieri ATCC MYA-4762]|uniref:Uncharacterized protein n=1 Tax=Terfezia boudieri ATCC MYA-4762 TaxID=1051890 RepID=A0A3N4M2D4_9PEZI|nr:hypothetical protein L211DRAFT_837368 [Terfezia boudieri ATCC MYA-4762]